MSSLSPTSNGDVEKGSIPLGDSGGSALPPPRIVERGQRVANEPAAKLKSTDTDTDTDTDTLFTKALRSCGCDCGKYRLGLEALRKLQSPGEGI